MTNFVRFHPVDNESDGNPLQLCNYYLSSIVLQLIVTFLPKQLRKSKQHRYRSENGALGAGIKFTAAAEFSVLWFCGSLAVRNRRNFISFIVSRCLRLSETLENMPLTKLELALFLIRINR